MILEKYKVLKRKTPCGFYTARGEEGSLISFLSGLAYKLVAEDCSCGEDVRWHSFATPFRLGDCPIDNS